MVQINKFNKLTLEEKAWYIWNSATFLHSREDSEFRYNLFYLNNYYVELLYNIQGNEVDKIRAFFSSTFITAYLENISLEELYD